MRHDSLPIHLRQASRLYCQSLEPQLAGFPDQPPALPGWDSSEHCYTHPTDFQHCLGPQPPSRDDLPTPTSALTGLIECTQKSSTPSVGSESPDAISSECLRPANSCTPTVSEARPVRQAQHRSICPAPCPQTNIAWIPNQWIDGQ